MTLWSFGSTSSDKIEKYVKRKTIENLTYIENVFLNDCMHNDADHSVEDDGAHILQPRIIPVSPLKSTLQM